MALRRTIRAEGTPVRVAVARVMALGSCALALIASCSQRRNWRVGLGSTSRSERDRWAYSMRRRAKSGGVSASLVTLISYGMCWKKRHGLETRATKIGVALFDWRRVSV